MDQSSQSPTQWAPIDDALIQIVRLTEDLANMEEFWVPMETIEESEEMETSEEVVEDVTQEEEEVETIKENIETLEVEQAHTEGVGEKGKESVEYTGGAAGIDCVGVVDEGDRGEWMQRGLREEGGGSQHESDESINLLAEDPIPLPFAIPPHLEEEDLGYESETDAEGEGWKTHDINDDGICHNCGLHWPQNQLCL